MVFFDRICRLSCLDWLTIVGQSPYQKPTDYLPRRCFMLIVLTVFLYVQVMTLVNANFAKDLLLQNLQLLGATVVGYLNIVMMYVKHEDRNMLQCKQMWKEMQDDWRTPRSEEEMKIKKKYSSECETIIQFSVAFLITMVIFAACSISLPLILDLIIPLNHTRLRRLPFYLDLCIDDQKYFIVYAIFYLMSVSVGIILFVANFSAINTFFYHLCGMYAVLGYKFVHAFDSAGMIGEVTEQSVADDKIIVAMESVKKSLHADHSYRALVDCVKAHHVVMNFMSMVNSLIAPIILSQILSVGIVISPSLAKLVEVNQVSLIVSIVVVSFTIFDLLYLYLVMGLGQKVLDSTTEMYDNIYNGKWYAGTPKVQKLLVLILKCGVPRPITAYKIIDVSLETAQMVLKVSISYCMTIRTFQ